MSYSGHFNSRKRKLSSWDAGGNSESPFSNFHPYSALEIKKARETLQRSFDGDTTEEFKALKLKMGIINNRRVKGAFEGWGEASHKFCEANLVRNVPGSQNRTDGVSNKRQRLDLVTTPTATSSSAQGDSPVAGTSAADDSGVIIIEDGAAGNPSSPVVISDDNDIDTNNDHDQSVITISDANDSIEITASSHDSDCVIVTDQESNRSLSDRSPSTSKDFSSNKGAEISVPSTSCEQESGNCNITVEITGSSESGEKDTFADGITVNDESQSVAKAQECVSVYMCDYCRHEFTTAENLKEHLQQQEHYSGSLVNVKIVNGQKNVPQFIEKAMVEVNDAGKFKTFLPVCHVCLQPFCTVIQCATHYISCHDEAGDQPSYYSLAKVTGESNITIQMEMPTCVECGEIGDLWKHISAHFRKKHGGSQKYVYYVCEHCFIPFSFHALFSHCRRFKKKKHGFKTKRESFFSVRRITIEMEEKEILKLLPLKNSVSALDIQIKDLKQSATLVGRSNLRKKIYRQIRVLNNILFKS